MLKTPTEDYRCQCGFSLNSTTDNACNANTGNKVAEHMMKCEYKYCSVFIEEGLSAAASISVNLVNVAGQRNYLDQNISS